MIHVSFCRFDLRHSYHCFQPMYKQKQFVIRNGSTNRQNINEQYDANDAIKQDPKPVILLSIIISFRRFRNPNQIFIMNFSANNVHPLINLNYNFPKSISEMNETTKGENSQGSCFNLADVPLQTAPGSSKSPLGKHFRLCEKDIDLIEPLRQILKEDQFVLKKVRDDLNKRSNKETLKEPISTKNSRKSKKVQNHKVVKSNRTEVLHNQKESINLSPCGTVERPHSLQQSTPVSSSNHIIKEAFDGHNLHRKNLALEKASKLTLETEDSDYDHLACHADNIMKMAVDSTMLGSTFSASLSFSSLNYDVDVLPRATGELAYEDAEKSVLETIIPKRRNKRSKQRELIMISAQDLAAAIL
ncbi:uncharacterized protein PRCAT00000297001 [Priceomyces carsonii]|uniref:uncharacterized protein n=1 Tax=Priceomyces carsonii TaxID=28549 RepID=UPI002EDAEBB1|nr:unnamed protein product [Priceomyces carsonii]